MVQNMRPRLDRSVLGHRYRATCQTTCRRTCRRQCPQGAMSRPLMSFDNVPRVRCRVPYCRLGSVNRRSRDPTRVLHAPPWATTSHSYGPGRRTAERPVMLVHLFSWTVLTRPLEHEVLTLIVSVH